VISAASDPQHIKDDLGVNSGRLPEACQGWWIRQLWGAARSGRLHRLVRQELAHGRVLAQPDRPAVGGTGLPEALHSLEQMAG
jgi:hypothetical protein